MPTRPLVTRYEDDLSLFPDRWHKVGVVAFVLVVLGLLVFGSDHVLTICNHALIAIVGTSAMMILTGFTGQVSLGHAAFIALGAYTVAILGGTFGLPFWLAMPFAGLVAALAGLTVGPFALRLEGLYLAIVTVGLLFVVEHVLRNGLEVAYHKDYLSVPMHLGFGQTKGLGAFRADTEIGPLVLAAKRKLYLLFVALAVFTVWVTKNIQRSDVGRAMMAVRDQDLASSALGVNPAKTKLLAFGVSSFFAGIAGAMYGFAHPVITLEPFNLKMSVEYIAMVVLGGVGTVFGAVSGAIAFTFLSPIAEAIGHVLPFPPGFSSEHQSVVLLFPALCVFLIFEPLGLTGVWLRLKRYFVAWPFRY